MGKWRPSELNCLYVIPDIHGMYDQLNLILKRILPLRKSDGGKDLLVFLGDYIDRREDSHKVVDLLIDLKKKYSDQIIFLRGNHEQMLLDAIKPSVTSYDYLFWMKNGGENSLLGYLRRAKQEIDNPYTIERMRVRDYIPLKHIEFFESLRHYYEFEDYIFVHAGCDPTKLLYNQDKTALIFDRSLYSIVRDRLNKVPLPWEKVVVTGHNGGKEHDVLIRSKFMMLDMSYKSNLLVMELRSMTGFVAKKGKKRLVGVKLGKR